VPSFLFKSVRNERAGPPFAFRPHQPISGEVEEITNQVLPAPSRGKASPLGSRLAIVYINELKSKQMAGFNFRDARQPLAFSSRYQRLLKRSPLRFKPCPKKLPPPKVMPMSS
jgi:hypothetical protein